jgi:RNA polymerase sigma-70 factor (ECF subfamily)
LISQIRTTRAGTLVSARELGAIEETRACRQESFEQEVAAQLDGLYPLALGLTRRVYDAEDLVQETAARALARSDQFEPGTNLRAWLHTIERSLFISGCRRERRVPPMRSLDHVEESALSDPRGTGISPSAEQELLRHWVSEDIVAALQALPEPYRAAVLLSDVEGLSYAEIAQAMGCALGTVMSRLHRGRSLLRRALGGPDDDPGAPATVSIDAIEALPAAA